MMKKSNIYRLITLFVVVALFLTACSTKGGNDTPAQTTQDNATDKTTDTAGKGDKTPAAEFDGVIKFGAVSPLTGASAESGIACKEGIDMAVAEINANGGVNVGGKKMKIEVIHEDGQGKPEVAVAAAEKLLNMDKVDLLMADTLISSCTLAVMELAPKYPDVLITTVECVSAAIPEKVNADPEKYKNFFKPCWNSDAYGASIADSVMYLSEKGVIPFENKTVAYIVEDTDYGRSNVTATEAAFEKYGARTVAFEVVPSGHTDFYSQINKLKKLKPDLVVTCFVPVASGVAYCKQARELGVEYTDFAIVYPSKAGFYDQVGNAADKLFWTTLLADFNNNDKHKEFANKILEYFPKTIPTTIHVSGYDVTNMVVDAIERAGTIKASEGLAEAYLNSDYQGLIARFVFNKDDHSIIAGEGYYPLSVAQVFGNIDHIVWPESAASKEPVPQR